MYWQLPVHLIGRRSDGSEFQNTYNDGKEFTFVQGEGETIRGLDKVVKTMKKGEKCILECPYDYAYGEQGFAGVIPPRATLLFEIKLIDW